MAQSSSRSIDWYFDFVSPYSYLALHRLHELSSTVSYKPVLFAGLLNHWGQKGPAEIAPKRRWTYRSCQWQASRLGIPFRFPAAHPFNPLQHLRLAIACGSSPEAVKRIFEWIWMSGGNANDPERFSVLCREMHIDEKSLGQPVVKDSLRKNTEEAATGGVFGVPSFVIDGEVFWGADSVDFAKAFLADPSVVRNEAMHRLDELPIAAVRTR
jgi:2-hydroxychromene-2-carboxylate isomerase